MHINAERNTRQGHVFANHRQAGVEARCLEVMKKCNESEQNTNGI